MDNNRKGALLKEERQKRSIALDTVHESTKIPMDALKAIEEGYTIRSLSPFYYKGFIKMYAKFLGLDLKEFVEDYHQEKLPEVIPVKAETLLPPEPKVSFAFPPELRKIILQAVVAVVALVVLWKFIGFVKQKMFQSRGSFKQADINDRKQKGVLRLKTQDRKLKEPVKNKIIPKENPVVSEKAVSEEAVSTSESRAPLVSPPSMNKKINLSIRAKKDTWVQVTSDGAVVFRAVLKKGLSESWFAKESIEISGKDIGDIDFELNGKILGSLARANRKAKKVIITQNGFTVL